MHYAVALRITTKGGEKTALFGMGQPEDGGSPVIASDKVARKHFEWGADFDPDDESTDLRRVVNKSPEADEAKACLARE